MRKLVLGLLVVVGAAATLVVASLATADEGSRNISARGGLVGYNETPLTLSTTGGGTFKAKVSNDGQSFAWTLTYQALEGSVLQSHIHFGAPAITGGISVFLCTNIGNAPPAPASPTQACPAPPATISGVAHANDVIGPSGQGIEAGAFGELVAAMRSGFAYANVHSSKWPGGEIRGQLSSGGNDDNDDD